jgi:hypothetical protein
MPFTLLKSGVQEITDKYYLLEIFRNRSLPHQKTKNYAISYYTSSFAFKSGHFLAMISPCASSNCCPRLHP